MTIRGGRMAGVAVLLCACAFGCGGRAADPRLVFQAHRITEIGLRRTPCFGDCPAYAAVLRVDGSFEYTGEGGVRRLGRYNGKADRGGFNQLARFVRDSGFMDLRDRYSLPVTDAATAHTTVVMGGRRKEVADYAGSGPPALWAIEQLIDKLLADAEWDGSPD